MHQDELKKLYAQLEVHKTKKMAANNPHLPKKRSSRCALGRSLIKRIAEIPETMSRQCSREEKDGSFRSRSGNHSDSFRRSTDTISISYRSSMKSVKSVTPSPSPSMRKSQSDHHYVRERDSLLHTSTLRANTVKRSSQRSETDSLDIPPGVCKSASAQNLTIDTNLLHPDHNRLHKSWSLTSASSHSMENIPKVNRANTVRSRPSLSISDQTRSALKSESFDKAEVCPWEVEPEQSSDKNQKHVTYANSDDGEEKRPPSPLALICPWDHLPLVETKSSVDKGLQGETESPSPPVSASAPGSPRPKVAKDQRVFSFRSTATAKWLTVKTLMGSMDAASRSGKDGSLNREDSISQKKQESASATPRSGTSRHPSIEKRSLHKRNMTTTDGKPCLVKQNAVRLSSCDSSERSPRRLVIVKSSVHPCDSDDMHKDGTYENLLLSRQSSKRSISSWETTSSSRTPSTHRRGSYRITPTRNVSHADVCSYDGASALQQGEGPKKQQSIKADICPWESQVPVHERSNVCPWESQEQGNVKREESGHGEVCPSESQDIPVVSHIILSKDSQAQQPLKGVLDICPWETAETPQPSVRQDHEYANVCPWDVPDKAEGVYENLNPLENRGTLTVPLQREVMKAAIYPGASKEVLNNEQQYHAISPAMNWGKQMNKTAASCPWDFPDPPTIKEDICPWEDGNKEPTNTDLTPQMTIKVHICPWESEQDNSEDSEKDASLSKGTSEDTERKESPRVNVCPWETALPEKNAATKTMSQELKRPAEVCPWETEEPESGKPEIPKTSESHLRQDTARTNVCPWETEETGTVKTEVPNTLDKLQRKGISEEHVPPLKAETPKVLKKQDSTRADVCPWETEEPKTLQKQDSTRTDVCPWETEHTKAGKRQDSIKDNVCPWETEESKTLQKQDSTRTDVCPWETVETIKKQNSNGAGEDKNYLPDSDKDVIESQSCLSVEEILADTSPEQTDESKANLALGRRDALCPWEMVRSTSGSFTDNASDVFTWEPENIPEEDEEDDAECAAEALVFPPDL